MIIETAAELHTANIDLLRRFDELCKSHDVHYFITFGTLLGAVRHGDIIPWDDDIDVTMVRSEYEKLVKIPAEEYPVGCELTVPGQDGVFVGFTPMFKDNEHMGRMIKGSDSDDGSGLGRLGIDIFVLDPSYTGIRHTILAYRQLFLYAQARAHRSTEKAVDVEGSRFFAAIAVRVLQSIGRHRKLSKMMDRYWEMSLNLKTSGDVLYSPCNIPRELSHEYDAEWFSDTVYLDLGGMSCPAPVGYKQFLERMFGDYMQLPPEDKRFPEHFVLKEFQTQ